MDVLTFFDDDKLKHPVTFDQDVLTFGFLGGGLPEQALDLNLGSESSLRQTPYEDKGRDPRTQTK